MYVITGHCWQLWLKGIYGNVHLLIHTRFGAWPTPLTALTAKYIILVTSICCFIHSFFLSERWLVMLYATSLHLSFLFHAKCWVLNRCWRWFPTFSLSLSLSLSLCLFSLSLCPCLSRVCKWTLQRARTWKVKKVHSWTNVLRIVKNLKKMHLCASPRPPSHLSETMFLKYISILTL